MANKIANNPSVRDDLDEEELMAESKKQRSARYNKEKFRKYPEMADTKQTYDDIIRAQLATEDENTDFPDNAEQMNPGQDPRHDGATMKAIRRHYREAQDEIPEEESGEYLHDTQMTPATDGEIAESRERLLQQSTPERGVGGADRRMAIRLQELKNARADMSPDEAEEGDMASNIGDDYDGALKALLKRQIANDPYENPPVAPRAVRRRR